MSNLEQKPLTGLEAIVEPQMVQDQTHAEAQRLFEQVLGDMPFGEQYATLLAEGWRWREAALIAWLAMPRKQRIPNTQAELANLLGIGDANLRDKKTPLLEARVAKLAAASIVSSVPDIMDALITSASKPNYKNHQDRKLALTMAGVYQEKQTFGIINETEQKDPTDLTPDELRRLVAAEQGHADSD